MRVASGTLGNIRIISGQWRRRRLEFPTPPGLRPTPDRVRETLFNWLGARVAGAACLDLFAGSGALGFEAASRGATKVVMVEQDSTVVRYLRRQIEVFGADNVQVIAANAVAWVRRPRPGTMPLFDVVFLDPPYGSVNLDQVCQDLERGDWLQGDALVYLETGPGGASPRLSGSLVLKRYGHAGQVRYYLAGRRLRPSP